MRQIQQSEVEDFTDKDLQDVYGKVEDLDVVDIDAFREEFLDHLVTDAAQSGIQLPWAETSDLVRLRMGEVSVWAGINGHMKSTVLNQCLTWAASKVPVGLASFEMSVKDTAKLMCMQSAASDQPSRDYGERFANWSKDKIFWYRILGGVQPIQCLGAIVAMARRGCKIVAIDNLQFTGVTEDIQRERLFFNQLMGLAEALDIHIAVVHHVRKPERGGDEYVPTRFDVRGGGTITDQCHLLMIVWHNKKRKEALNKQMYGIPLNDREQEVLEKQSDLKLVVAKQRHGTGFEGTIGLFQTSGRAFKKRENSRALVLEEI